MMGEMQIVEDPIAVKLDELADLGEIWKKYTDARRLTGPVRLAMIQISSEIQAITRFEKVTSCEGENNG